MHQETLSEIVQELSGTLYGRTLGKIFQLSASSLAIDFGLRGAGYLFISVDPAAPRLYLIKRSVRELEKQSRPLSPAAQSLRSALSSARLESFTKETGERIVRFALTVTNDLGESESCYLVAQLTGRSANLLLLNSEDVITHVLRETRGAGQQVGQVYEAPRGQAGIRQAEQRVERSNFPTISEAADSYYSQLDSALEFDQMATNVAAHVNKEVRKRKKLRENLKKDLLAHGNPDEHKRTGDLILANLINAVRVGHKVTLRDYYQEGAPSIELEVDENISLQDAAGEYFSRYGKAKRAIEEIGSRLIAVERELEELEAKQERLREAIDNRDEAALSRFTPSEKKLTGSKKKAATAIPGTRRYRSSDGYEVIMGKAARDNDNLTFRVARPNDLWLHAGDYPGSHVIIRNSSRKEIPHRTIVEAAQLAAKFSQAGKDAKVNIYYTPRKFLSKPKGAAPGLVRMSTFKTITVEPAENMERM